MSAQSPRGKESRGPGVMRVRMLTSIAGTDDLGVPYTLEAGREYDLPVDEARDLVARPDDMPRAEPVVRRARDSAETR